MTLLLLACSAFARRADDVQVYAVRTFGPDKGRDVLWGVEAATGAVRWARPMEGWVPRCIPLGDGRLVLDHGSVFVLLDAATGRLAGNLLPKSGNLVSAWNLGDGDWLLKTDGEMLRVSWDTQTVRWRTAASGDTQPLVFDDVVLDVAVVTHDHRHSEVSSSWFWLQDGEEIRGSEIQRYERFHDIVRAELESTPHGLVVHTAFIVLD